MRGGGNCTVITETRKTFFFIQEHRESKEQRERESRKSETKEVLREPKKHKDPKEYKESTSQDKPSKKVPLLPSTSSVSAQEVTAAASTANSPPHEPHATVGASTSNIPTTLYGTTGPSTTQAAQHDTFVTGHAHGKQLSPIQSASTLRNSPTQELPGTVLSKGSVPTSQGLSTKGTSSHAMSLSKTNIGLGVVGPRHESPPGPPPFR